MTNLYNLAKEPASVSVCINNKFLNNLDQALKKAQIERKVPMIMARSEDVRYLMTIETTEVFYKNAE